MKVAKAATGAKRYKLGTSNAPTRGKVNPSGYIQREVRKRNQAAGRGNDGKSDRRSGLAKSALRNVKRYAPSRPVSTRPEAKFNNPNFGSLFHKVNQPSPNAQQPPKQKFINDPVSQFPAPNIPTVQINENGQLDLPFNDAFGMDMVNYQQQMNSDLLGLQQEQQAQQMGYANSKRDLGLQYEDMKRGTLNSNAAGGTAFSSQYAVGASDNARNYNNAVNDLDAANSMAMSGFNNQRMGIQNAMNDYIRQAILQQSMGLADEAGSLGYGQAAPEQVVNPSSSKPSRSSKPTSKIGKYKSRGLDKSQIVAKLTGTKDGSGAAKQLSKSQLKQIGFSDKFISKVKSNSKKKKK